VASARRTKPGVRPPTLLPVLNALQTIDRPILDSGDPSIGAHADGD
jgi:hypothetical protein